MPPPSTARVLWLEAGPSYCFQDAGATTPCASGDAVYTWVDQSGNAYNFSQSSSNRRPVLVQDGGTGKWYVDFQHTNSIDFLVGGDPSGSFSGAGSVGIRFWLDSNSSYQLLRTRANSSYDAFGDSATYTGQLRGSRLNGVAITPLTTGAWHTHVVRSDGAAWTRRADGSAELSQGADFNAGDSWVLGANDGNDAKLDGRIAGAVAYSAYLSGSDLTDLETYLSGLTDTGGGGGSAVGADALHYYREHVMRGGF